MKPQHIAVLVGLAWALAACSTPTKVEHGAVQGRTFSFVSRAPAPPNYVDTRASTHQVIQAAIAQRLARSGVTKVDAGGDLTVGYLVIVGNNASTTSINDYFGYGQDADALVQKAHAAATGSKNPNYFEAGTLVIDIIDTKSFKLLKRGYATRKNLRSLPEDARVAEIQEVVDEILADLKIRN